MSGRSGISQLDAIVLAGRKERIKLDFYYARSIEFMAAGKKRLTRDTVWDATWQDIELV